MRWACLVALAALGCGKGGKADQARARAGAHHAALMRCLVGDDVDVDRSVELRKLGLGGRKSDWPGRCAPLARGFEAALAEAKSSDQILNAHAHLIAEQLAAGEIRTGRMDGLSGLQHWAEQARLPPGKRIEAPAPPERPRLLEPAVIEATLQRFEGPRGDAVPLVRSDIGPCWIEGELAGVRCQKRQVESPGVVIAGADGSLAVAEIEDGQGRLEAFGQPSWSGPARTSWGGFASKAEVIALFEAAPGQLDVVRVVPDVEPVVTRVALPDSSSHGVVAEWLLLDGKSGLQARKLGGAPGLGAALPVRPYVHVGRTVLDRDLVACRSADTLAIASTAARQELLWVTGDRWQALALPAVGFDARLDCPGGEATLSWVDQGILHVQRCTPAGCQGSQAKSPAEADFSELAVLGNEVILTGRLHGYGWMWRGPLDRLSATPPTLLQALGGASDIVVRGDVVVLLFGNTQPVRLAPGAAPALLQPVIEGNPPTR